METRFFLFCVFKKKDRFGFILILILFFSQKLSGENIHMFVLLTVIIPPGKAKALCSVRHGGYRLIITDIYSRTQTHNYILGHLETGSSDELCPVWFGSCS